MDEIQKFEHEVKSNIENLGQNVELKRMSIDWIRETSKNKYSYNFKWLGRPIIQYPEDIVGMHELIWNVKPDLIIETGVAHGGSLIFYASQLLNLDYEEAFKNKSAIIPGESKRKVLGIDIDIRKHNLDAIKKNMLSPYIDLLEGSSVSESMIEKVRVYSKGFKKILVILDSNHTHEHVLKELNLYSDLVSKDSYCVVFDTVVEDMPEDMFPDRPWGKSNNPKTAVWDFLKSSDKFEIDHQIDNKLLISVAPQGYLKRIK